MQKNLLRAAKILLSIALVFVIYRYFFKVNDIESVWQKMRTFPWHFVLFSIAVASVNWGIEARKWQVLTKQLQPLKYYPAFKSICAGAAVSNILPFRIGEYLGRIVYILPENRIAAAFNSILGSSCQLLISLLFGIPASLYMLEKEDHAIAVYAGIAVVGIPLFFFLFFQFFLKHKTFQKKWLRRLSEDIRKFTVVQILHVLWLSLWRYLVFGSFYVFLLIFFGIRNDILECAAGVSTIYLLQSFVPSMVITDAGLRTGLPLMVFKATAAMQPSLLAAALLNYIFNLVLPSLTGLCFIIAEKIKNK